MNKHKKLVLNTVYFMVGTLGSKVIQFILIPFYTMYLTVNEYGNIEMILNIATIIIPLVSLNLMEALFRFTLDDEYNKKQILSTVNIFIIIGLITLLLISPIFKNFKYIGNRFLLIYTIIVLQVYQNVLKQFVRAIGKIKIFMFSDIINTIVFLVSNIILIAKFKMGITGYLYSLILAYSVELVILFINGHAIKYMSFNIKFFNKEYLLEMLKFSIPLIPTAVMLWIISASDKYVIDYMYGSDSVGIYSIANKLSAIILVVNGIFFRAWQITAVEESKNSDKSKYFSKAFKFYCNFLFVFTGILILFLRLINLIIIRGDFKEARNYVGILIIGTVVASFSNFLSSLFIAEKQTKIILISSIIGAVFNVILNFAFIKTMGILGACLATFLAYFIMFSIRYFGAKSLVKLDGDYKRIIINLFAVMIQVSASNKGIISINILMFIILILINKNLFQSANKLFKSCKEDIVI